MFMFMLLFMFVVGGARGVWKGEEDGGKERGLG